MKGLTHAGSTPGSSDTTVARSTSKSLSSGTSTLSVRLPALSGRARTCQPFASTLNNSNCIAFMSRNHTAGDSPLDCAAACCEDPACNAWLYHHVPGGQCWISPSAVDSAKCHKIHPSAAGPAFIGESRHALPPPSPSPPAVVRKQGFSGFLGPDWTCGDADALNLKDSWWYTWAKNTAQYRQCPAGTQAVCAPSLLLFPCLQRGKKK